MSLEQILLYPLSGRFYSHGEIEKIINEAMSYVIPPPVQQQVPALATKRSRRTRR
jgi:hypothetical protein